MNPIIEEALRTILLALASAIGLGLTALIKLGFDYLRKEISRIDNETVRDGLYAAEDEARRLTETIVASTNQTIVEHLKSQTGKLSREDAIRLKNEALQDIEDLLSQRATEILEEHKGDLHIYLGHLLEDIILSQKKTS